MEQFRYIEPEGTGVTLVTFPALEAFPEIAHAFSTRAGGVSGDIFATMNLSFGRGDADDNVRENFRRAMRAIGIPEGCVVFTKQTHKTEVLAVTAAERGIGLERPIPYDDIDGLVTDVPDVALTVMASDCVPVYLYDPVRRAIGLCHAGWRGTVGGIARITAEKMASEYGSRPEDIRAVVGPSIGPECFEVGEEVAEEFAKVFGESVIRRIPGARPHVDLWEANRQAMLAGGLAEEHITVSGVCTMCHPDIFFSHRATGGRRGGNAAFLMLRA